MKGLWAGTTTVQQQEVHSLMRISDDRRITLDAA
jgi:hypothetical protein